ncbi:MAG: M1 family metallopeptidase, partial [Desulfobacterales bacterium]|nr:M1 family metallopeptidase [Desulfobacterales bacterium]
MDEKPTPVNYSLHLEPDLINFTFSATIDVLLDAPDPVKEISLNVLELAVWNCRVLENSRSIDCSFTLDPQKETLCIRLPGARRGRIAVRISYQGHINDKMAGFYRSGYTRRGQKKPIAVTQFQESDARRAFPCLDRPGQKATFDIVMDVPPHFAVVCNTPVQSESLLANGKKRHVFARTPRMSTYLVFWGVGPFQLIQDRADPRVRVAALPGRKKYAGFALGFARKALAFSETYYGLSYPLPKLDLLAVPDFAFGAMENWGAITFRENLLLYYPGVTSNSGRQRIAEVIAHEIAHQWFGNLVTPSDWKYLWLNESFATFFGYGVVDHFYPRWSVWDQFLHGMTAPALSRDALHETTPIEIPGGEHVVINTSTAPIIYNKGGSILRQIQGYIGQDNLRQGLRDYLQKHAYGSAASHHLWDCLEAVSEQPVRAMMKSWIEQAGYPVVEVRRSGRALCLKQQRFTYLPNHSDQKWLIPVTLRLFFEKKAPQLVTVLMDDREKEIPIPADVLAYKINHQQTGFYRVRYADAGALENLGRCILRGALSPEDRWGLQNDLFAQLEAGQASLETYLGFLDHYCHETAYLPLTGIVG